MPPLPDCGGVCEETSHGAQSYGFLPTDRHLLQRKFSIKSLKRSPVRLLQLNASKAAIQANYPSTVEGATRAGRAFSPTARHNANVAMTQTSESAINPAPATSH